VKVVRFRGELVQNALTPLASTYDSHQLRRLAELEAWAPEAALVGDKDKAVEVADRIKSKYPEDTIAKFNYLHVSGIPFLSGRGKIVTTMPCAFYEQLKICREEYRRRHQKS
jgi:hypothetical protein